jgi:hypothetical protein
MEKTINLVKTFSVTKAREREELGARVTQWIAANPGVQIVRTFIAQTSDDRFHCMSMVLLCVVATT